MQEPFSVKVAHDNGETLIHPRGEIDVATTPELREAIEPALGSDASVVVDLSDVTFMDSSGIALFAEARAKQDACGGSFLLRNPTPLARRVIAITGLEFLFGPE